jgi:predicted HD superfamily hydrolase involved in NAD metabolism
MAKAETKREGIPEDLTLEKARDWVRPRVSERRFKHIEGVAEVAKELAKHMGADPFVAELGGILHDACKETKDKILVAQAKEFGLKLHPIEEQSGHLLHGPVSALTAKKELGVTDTVLLHAISEHTLGAVDMTVMSQILFLADCLDETRPDDYTVPIWNALGYKTPDHTGRSRKFVGELDMESAILAALNAGLQFLIQDNKTIHPKTIEVRNWYLRRIKERHY